MPNKKTAEDSGLDFWGHLDVLRDVLWKILLVTLLFGIVAFIFKEQLFALVLAPKESGFVTYRWMAEAAAAFGHSAPDSFSVNLINTGLAQQFIIHIKTALCMGVVFASPYILYQLFRFVSPALYDDERKYVVRVAGGGYVMFMLGVLLSYYLIFPFTFRFLGTYQVSGEVANMITLDSYMGTLLMLCLTMGIVFELPVVCWLFGKLGFLTDTFMQRYRKHAIVIILTVAAIITPTSDVVTLTLVSLPIWLLYEFSILLVRRAKPSASAGAVWHAH